MKISNVKPAASTPFFPRPGRVESVGSPRRAPPHSPIDGIYYESSSSSSSLSAAAPAAARMIAVTFDLRPGRNVSAQTDTGFFPVIAPSTRLLFCCCWAPFRRAKMKDICEIPVLATIKPVVVMSQWLPAGALRCKVSASESSNSCRPEPNSKGVHLFFFLVRLFIEVSRLPTRTRTRPPSCIDCGRIVRATHKFSIQH